MCRALIEPGDVILVKGSRGVHLETVIEMLKERKLETRNWKLDD
jgi:UDP-N-acetylmuramyl pentapeptide synthase